MIIQPHLGKDVTTGGNTTPADFLSAMYAAGSSLAVVQTSDFRPQSAPLEAFFLFNSHTGMSVLSLTLTYMMQIYSGLHTRNAFGLKIRTLTGGTDDATELIVGLGPQGRFDPGFATLSSLTGELAAMKEYHHFYPVLFYFRFEEPYYSTYHSTLMLLDTGHLLKSTLNDEEFIGYPHASMGRN